MRFWIITFFLFWWTSLSLSSSSHLLPLFVIERPPVVEGTKKVDLCIWRGLWRRKKMPKSKQKRRSNNASGFIGVSLNVKRYQAQIYINGKKQYLDTYDTAKQAAKAYDAAAIELGRSLSKLNFPKKVPPGYTPTQDKLSSTNTSGYRGVSKRKYGYQAQIKIKGKLKHLGLFITRKQTAVAYDHAVHKHCLPKSLLNFPSMKHNLN